jgi:hypothetical protein
VSEAICFMSSAIVCWLSVCSVVVVVVVVVSGGGCGWFSVVVLELEGMEISEFIEFKFREKILDWLLVVEWVLVVLVCGCVFVELVVVFVDICELVGVLFVRFCVAVVVSVVVGGVFVSSGRLGRFGVGLVERWREKAGEFDALS